DAAELHAAAALLAWLTEAPCLDGLTQDLARRAKEAPPDTPAARTLRWARLELAPPGADAIERAETLHELAEAKQCLPPEGGGDASTVGTLLVLSGFNRLSAGDTKRAVELFREVTDLLPEDVGGWEGLRAAALQLGDAALEAEACTELARRAC